LSELSPGIKIGFVGCGEIVRIRHLPALAKVAGCDVTALADSDSSQFELLEHLFPAAARYGSSAELINSPQVDLVAVCGPPEMHSRTVIAALEAGKRSSRNRWHSRSKNVKRSVAR
jgi:predicted dehydrogenase